MNTIDLLYVYVYELIKIIVDVMIVVIIDYWIRVIYFKYDVQLTDRISKYYVDYIYVIILLVRQIIVNY